MGIGAVLVIVGIVVMIVSSFWLGLVFGGFRRGSWY